MEMAWSCVWGALGWIFGLEEVLHPEVVAWNREVFVTPRLTEPKEHLDNVLRDRVGFLGCAGQGQGLDSVHTGPSEDIL